MFTVSMISSCLVFCLCNDVIMRYMLPHAFALESRWKTFRFSDFHLPGLHLDHSHLHSKSQSVRRREKVRMRDGAFVKRWDVGTLAESTGTERGRIAECKNGHFEMRKIGGD